MFSGKLASCYMPREKSRNCSIEDESLAFAGRCYICGDYENDDFVDADNCTANNETETETLCVSGFCAVSIYKYHTICTVNLPIIS